MRILYNLSKTYYCYVFPLIFVFFASTISANAANWYVSSMIGSNGYEGTEARPFATLQYAHSKTNAGDVVYIMNGTYYPAEGSELLHITRSGSANNHITYKSYSGHYPKLIVRKGSKSWAAIRVSASYITIDGLELMGDNDNITLAEGEARHDHYLANKASNTVDWGYMASTNTNGIYIKGDNNTHSGPVHVIVRNCLVHKFPGSGIAAEIVDYITYENNTVHSNAWYMIYAGSGLNIFHPWNSDTNTSTYRIVVKGNRSYNNETRVKWADRSKYSDGNGIIIDDFKNNQISKTGADNGKLYRLNYQGKTQVANNESYGNGGCGINVFSSKNVDAVQNTMYNNSASPNLDWPDFEVNASDNVRAYNNIAYATRGKAFGAYNNTNHINDYNLYFNGTASGGGANNITGADPKFADRFNNNFKLQNGSPAIDNGTHTAASYVDFDGTTRPQGDGMDRGAHEYVASYTSQNVYTDALATDWSDWSWSSTRNFSNTAPLKSGTKSLKVNYTSAGGGLGLRKGTAIGTANLNSIKFWVYSTTARTLTFQTQSADGAGEGLSTGVSITTLAGAWKEISISKAQLGSPSQIKRMNIVAGNFSGEVVFDEIRLVMEGSVSLRVHEGVSTKDRTASEPTSLEKTAFSIYPNPVATEMYVRMHAVRGDMLQVNMYTLTGQQVSSVHEPARKDGEHTVVVSTRSIAAGTYLVRYGSGSNMKAELVIVR